ncbi:hypothetical protein GCM10010371_34440 [Streptomyces subrutilus]|uniref:Uncharacterized protein n=1 Tax=Streptomyces subrutilus TaxID=36818 RepID=A0A918QTP7_9ACTN|nr:hypothetical protein GCM10010371_34440 [Streptomyces subrutilus]
MDDPQAFSVLGLPWHPQVPLSAAPPEKETKASAACRPVHTSEVLPDGCGDGAAPSGAQFGDHLVGPDSFPGRAGAGEESPAG